MTRKGHHPENARPSHRTARTEHGSQKRNSTAQIYDDLLEEALRQSSPDLGRPLKRRKSQRGADEVITIDSGSSGGDDTKETSERDVVVIDSSSNEQEDSDDEEMEWDNVDLTTFPTSDDIPDTEESPAVREVTLTTTPQKSPFVPSLTRLSSRKKRVAVTPRNAIVRQIRMEAHKMHLLCLLASFRHLNSLLSSPELLKMLRPMVPPATRNALNSGPEVSQARRTIAFLSGLKDIVATWSERWKQTKKGWRRPRWVDKEDLGKIPEYLDLTESISLDGLMNAAKIKSGSRDVGAWLFTALLRSVGVQTRLVCSLQPLQYGFLNEGPRQAFYSLETPQQQAPTTAMLRDQSHISISSTDTPPPPRSTIRNPSFPSSSRDVGTYNTPAEYIADRKTFSPYNPFFWSEAWDVASQKWIAVEPMVAARVNQPSKIEPPVNAAAWEAGAIGDNILSYAVGFDNSGFAKDVTRRYAKAFYSKTWKHRVESQGGEKWWTRVINYLDRMEPLDRDQLEEVDLSNHVLKEPVPKKIDDFRHHPLYVLERHLRRNELLAKGAVHVSALTSGKGMKVKTEYVYKRKDVIPCFSAREWFRRGRIIKEAEQPIKRTNPASQRRRSSSVEEDNDTSTALYSESQTELYIPPPVINGVIPKNTYGNIDIYVPSMVPAGAAHIIRPSISLAAQFAGIDYADAVTGFDFVRNKANARVSGIVVAQDNVEGLLEVWEGMMERVRGEEERRRVQGVMERWRRFLIGMGIRRRLEEMHGKVEDENMVDDEDDENEDLGGGFLRGAVQDGQGFGDGFGSAPKITTAEMTTSGEAQPSGQQEYSSERDVTMRKTGDDDDYREDGPDNEHDQEMDDDLSGGFEKDNDVQMKEEAKGGGFIHDDIKDSEGGGVVQETSDSEGGFMYDDEDGIL